MGQACEQDGRQVGFADQDLRGVWAPFRMAAKMGQGLGRGALLLRALSARQIGYKRAGLTSKPSSSL